MERNAYLKTMLVMAQNRCSADEIRQFASLYNPANAATAMDASLPGPRGDAARRQLQARAYAPEAVAARAKTFPNATRLS